MKPDDHSSTALVEASSSARALQASFDGQRHAFSAEPYASWPVRKDRLERLLDLLTSHAADIAQAIARDFGHRSQAETQLIEVVPSIRCVRYALKHGARWMNKRRLPLSWWAQFSRAWLMPQPLGVVGIVVPWNYPLFLVVAPMVGALTAGNRVLIKLSERAPEFARLFEELVRTRFTSSEVAVVNGDASVAEHFAQLPFDHLLFTGSARNGRKVARSAAAQLVPVTLELGGKSPCVIAPDYPLPHAAERILFGKLLNAGQTCVAPDYVLLPRAQLDEFVSVCRSTASTMHPTGLAHRDYASLIDTREYERLTQWIDEAEQQGARVEPLFPGPTRDAQEHRLAPVLVVDPSSQCMLMRKEIFGPLLVVVPYDSIKDALAYIRMRPHPLALYWFDRDRTRIDFALRSTHAGGVTINDTIAHVAHESLPFGGIGKSGYGRYRGRFGFETFSAMKPVLEQSGINPLRRLRSPRGEFAHKVIEWMKRL